MVSTLEYLAAMHQSFRYDYVMPEGHTADCLDIAMQIAYMLCVDQKNPRIVVLRELQKNGRISKAALAPVRYAGKVSWDFHIVACSGSEAFDPLVSAQPVSLGEYSVQAFGRQVPMEEFVSAEMIKAVTSPLACAFPQASSPQ